MKNILLLIASFTSFYFLIKYKNLKEAMYFDGIDIETKEDLLDKMGLIKDPEGNIHEKEV
ncbi:hypothetical protein M4L38_13780 [Staphylococcus equorum]|uniref:hypothetical protein n=1 Tax=Staphylococcus equorum TaxID=246432 RepID=UPI002407BDD6|nr:hypothetical protein [Staphylococcus equorum]MDG0823797.1 hypothetical protein [Staphylococcus equorum]